MSIKLDLDKLNSLTKYPSIPTYHALGQKGRLTDEHMALSGRVIATEKVDGTNARVVISSASIGREFQYIIGSREELLYARGDLLANPCLGIVDAVREIAERTYLNEVFPTFPNDPDDLIVVYGEAYGGKIGDASKQYSKQGKTGFRVFDVARISLWREKLAMPIEKIASWREHGGQEFMGYDAMINWQPAWLDKVSVIYDGDAASVPTRHDEVLAWLRENLPMSQAVLDDSAGGKPEGLVIRTPDRKAIVKVRFEDYERTLRPVR